jgi:glycosyltransferase involved in cell wall biosynthesis
MGRMDLEKGVKDLIESYKFIQCKRKNIILLLVGKDEMNINSYLENLNFEIRNKIIYLEHSESPHEILNIANIFCIPSKREGFGNSVIESSACEVPVVGSNIFGLNSSLIDEYNGLTFEVNNTKDLSFKLLKLIDDSRLCMQLGKNGRNYVVKNFEKK